VRRGQCIVGICEEGLCTYNLSFRITGPCNQQGFPLACPPLSQKCMLMQPGQRSGSGPDMCLGGGMLTFGVQLWPEAE
jgi:hypothetical protein